MNKTKENIMTYEQMRDKVTKLLDNAEEKMNELIEDYNENNAENTEVDTVDLSGKFSELQDYVEDYTSDYETVEIQ
tara:strand:- start:272 stop:499 length:228 start_codon:yes stop_codon:yes gene_type:complete